MLKLYDGRYNGQRDELFNALNVSSSSFQWFPNEYIENYIERSQKRETSILQGNQRRLYNYYIGLLNATPNKLESIKGDIDKLTFGVLHNHV
jgi:hypothetical protein